MEPEEDDGLEYLRKLDRFFDGEEQTTAYFELEKLGQAPPLFPNDMSDEEISLALTNLVWGLFDLHVQIDDADHLTDRELYEGLLEFCDEPNVFFPGMEGAWFHWSPIGECSDEDIDISHRYYSSEESRAYWMKEYPDYEMPPSELPPHYRSWLPHRANLEESG